MNRFFALAGAAPLALALFAPAPTQALDRTLAYTGFLKIDGIEGGAKSTGHEGWIQLDGHYWTTTRLRSYGNGPGGSSLRLGNDERRMREDKAYNAAVAEYKKSDPMTVKRGGIVPSNQDLFSGPVAPKSGPSKFYMALDKRSPALKQLMAYCASKKVIPHLTFDEPPLMARPKAQIGPIPADVPAYYRFELTDITVSDCPQAPAGATAQGFEVSATDISWVNYKGPDVRDAFGGVQIPLAHGVDMPGETKSWVMTWFGPAVTAGTPQEDCAKMNESVRIDEMFTYAPKTSETAALRTEVDGQFKKAFEGSFQLKQWRGPGFMNVCMMPTVVPDHGLMSPRATKAIGLNLDGTSDGRATPATCAHQKFAGIDGTPAVDNQLFRVIGCYLELRRGGQAVDQGNSQMHNGEHSILIEVRGIEGKKDDDVMVSILYSRDHLEKDASGSKLLGEFSFVIEELDAYDTYYDTIDIPGRIVNGVLVTDPVDHVRMKLFDGVSLPPEIDIEKARLRLELLPDGNMKGVLAGYQDWRFMYAGHVPPAENFLLRCDALYNAFKRAADGDRDPDTGQCSSISQAYEIEAIPAFAVRSSALKQAQSASNPWGN